MSENHTEKEPQHTEINVRLLDNQTLDRCPSCKGEYIDRIGSLPTVYRFLDKKHCLPVNRGDLVRCRNCGLLFRNPCLSLDAMNKLYETYYSESTWEGDGDGRNDFRKIADFICSMDITDPRILDIGCYTGSLMHFLRSSCPCGDRFQLFGIEPSRKAAAVAEKRGVKIIGRYLWDIDYVTAEKFDVIIMTDVFEHILESNRMMQTLAGALLRKGCIIITTGAYDSIPFRMARNKYYYAVAPEHVSFLTKEHAMWLAQTNGFSMDYVLIRHNLKKQSTFKMAVISLVSLVLNLFPSQMFGINLPVSGKFAELKGRGIQNICNYPDHVMAVFRRVL